MNIRTYNPKQVSISLAGVELLGFGEDVFCRITPLDDMVKTVKGIDGKTAYTKNLNFDCNVEITFLQNSPSDISLRTAYIQAQQDSDDKENLPSYPVSIVDYSGGLLWSSDSARVVKFAEASLGANQQARTWTLYCENMKCKFNQTIDDANILGTILKTGRGLVDNTTKVVDKVRTFFG